MKLREIERLRACAALLVLVVHWEPLKKFLPWVLGDPWSGVDLFFVISGYVVSLSILRLLPSLEGEPDFLSAFRESRAGLKTFYVRRFFRIMPAALTVAFVTRALCGVFPHIFSSVPYWDAEFVAFIGGIYNYRAGFSAPRGLIVYWSLSVEEHFYLLLPMVFIVFRTRGRRFAACAALALFSILARALALPTEAQDLNVFAFQMYASHLRFDSLMAGVFLALVSDLPRTTPLLPPRLVKLVIVPTALLVIAGIPRAAALHVAHRAGFVALWMLSGLLVSFASKDEGYVLEVPILRRVLEYLGARSYAIYLVHSVVSRVDVGLRELLPKLVKLAPDSEFPYMHLGLLAGGTWIASEVLYRVVERPFMHLGGRIIAAEGRFRLSRWGRVALVTGLLAFGAVYFRHRLLTTFGPRNIALHAFVTTSSHEEGRPQPDALTNGVLEAELGLHTRREDYPWATIDLGEPRQIGAIRIYNRDDGYQEEALPLEMSVSDDGKEFRVIAWRDEMFTQEYPWRIKVEGRPVRWVRFSVARPSVLCLSEVEIYEQRWMAAVP